MTDLLKTALLLEEKASRLDRSNPKRAFLLAQAKACRVLALKDETPEYSELRAAHIEQTAQSLPEGSQARKDEMFLAHQMQERSSRLAIRKNLALGVFPAA